jgi:hypothetical protein
MGQRPLAGIAFPNRTTILSVLISPYPGTRPVPFSKELD